MRHIKGDSKWVRTQRYLRRLQDRQSRPDHYHAEGTTPPHAQSYIMIPIKETAE